MDIPERLQELVEQLGQSMVRALTTDSESRALAQRIQAEGFEVAMMIEATIALRSLEQAEGEAAPPAEPPSPDLAWSEEDRAFLHTFKISLD